MQEADRSRGGHREQRQRLRGTLPQPNRGTDLGVIGQVAVERRLIGMVQHVHHMGSADARRIVKTRLVEAARFQILDALLGMLLHILLGAEDDCSGRAGLHAGGLQADAHAVGAQGAFIRFLVLLRDARHVEWTPGHAVAAADAILFLEIDDAVGVLHDRARRRTGLETAGIFAVHAAVLADQPFQVALGILVLGETHQGPRVLAQIGRVVIVTGAGADIVAQVIPFHAGDLAGLAADALGRVDELRHLTGVCPAHFGFRQSGRRAADDVE